MFPKLTFFFKYSRPSLQPLDTIETVATRRHPSPILAHFLTVESCHLDGLSPCVYTCVTKRRRFSALKLHSNRRGCALWTCRRDVTDKGKLVCTQGAALWQVNTPIPDIIHSDCLFLSTAWALYSKDFLRCHSLYKSQARAEAAEGRGKECWALATLKIFKAPFLCEILKFKTWQTIDC